MTKDSVAVLPLLADISVLVEILPASFSQLSEFCPKRVAGTDFSQAGEDGIVLFGLTDDGDIWTGPPEVVLAASSDVDLPCAVPSFSATPRERS